MVTNMKSFPKRERILEMACLSQLAYIAYIQRKDIVSNILKSGCPSFFQKYDIVEFIYAKNPLIDTDKLTFFGLFLSTESDIVISIRGTKKLEDHFLNLFALPNSESIHSGFNSYVNSIWQQIKDFIQRTENLNKNIFLTGHSSGGAVATLITKKLNESNLKPITPYILETYTFGSPPISTRELDIDIPIYRFRTIGDFVPYLHKIAVIIFNKIPGIKQGIINWQPKPVQILSKYYHIGSEYCINEKCQIILQNESNLSNIMLITQISRLLDSQIKSPSQLEINHKFLMFITTLVKASLEEHCLTKYIERLSFDKLPFCMTNL